MQRRGKKRASCASQGLFRTERFLGSGWTIETSPTENWSRKTPRTLDSPLLAWSNEITEGSSVVQVENHEFGSSRQPTRSKGEYGGSNLLHIAMRAS